MNQYNRMTKAQLIDEVKRLRESEESLLNLFEKAPLAYQSLDEDGNFLECNETWCRTLGYKKEEVLGKNFSDFIHPDYRQVFKENFPKFKRVGYILGVEFEMMKKDGSEVIVSFDGRIGHKQDGSFRQTYCVLQDITGRRLAEQLQKVLFGILEASLAPESIEALSERIHSAVSRLMDARNFFLAIYDGKTGTYAFPYFADERDSGTMDLSKPTKLGRGFTEYVRRSKNPLLIDKALVQDLVDRGEVEIIGSRSESWMGVPLLDGDEVIAVVVVQSYSDPDAYSEEDLAILTYVSGYISMVLKKVQAEEALRASEELYLDLAQAQPAGIYRIRVRAPELIHADQWYSEQDSPERIEFANNVFCELVGSDRETLTNHPGIFGSRVHPEDREEFARLNIEANVKRIPFEWEGRLMVRSKERWVHLESLPRPQAGGETVWTGICYDITEQKRAEKEVLDSRDRLRELTARLDEVREEERTILARELHDEVGQNLTAMRMELSQIEKEIPTGWERVSDSLHSMIAITQDSVDRVNRLSRELRSPILDMLGLADAVESEVWDFEQRWGTEISLDMEIRELETLPERDLTIFKILKESLSNVSRHAQAGRVEVSLRVAGEEVVLEVVDNGIGITVDQVKGRKSFGLMGMRERAGRLGGEFDVQRREEGGTRVLARLPTGPTEP